MLSNLKVSNTQRAATYKLITSNLINNITKHTCSVLTNMIILDYISRLELVIELSEHVKICVKRLQCFLKQTVIVHDDFATIVELFIIAITPESNDYKDKTNVFEQEHNNALIASTVIDMCFDNLDDNTKNETKSVLQYLLQTRDSANIINCIDSDPKAAQIVLLSAYSPKYRQRNVRAHVHNEFKKMIYYNTQIDKTRMNLMQTVCKVAMLIGVLGSIVSSAFVAGASSPALLITVAAAAVTFSPKISQNLGNTMLRFNREIKSLRSTMHNACVKSLQQDNNVVAPQIIKSKVSQMARNLVQEDGAILKAVQTNIMTHVTNNAKISKKQHAPDLVENKFKNNERTR